MDRSGCGRMCGHWMATPVPMDGVETGSRACVIVEHPPQRAFHATESAARTQVEPHAGRWYLEGHDPTTDGAAAERQVAGTGRGAGGGRRGGLRVRPLRPADPGRHQRLGSDLGRHAGTAARPEPVRGHPGAAVAQLSAVSAARAPAHGSVHVHPARRRARRSSPASGPRRSRSSSPRAGAGRSTS